MTELEIKLLQEIYDASDFHQEEEINLLNVSYAAPLEVKETLEELQAQNMVLKNPVNNRYRVTTAGRIELKKIKNRTEHKPENNSPEKREKSIKKSVNPLDLLSKILDLAGKIFDLIHKFFVLFLIIMFIVIFH